MAKGNHFNRLLQWFKKRDDGWTKEVEMGISERMQEPFCRTQRS